tara:strand:+ start:114 stop:1865 length:1752 start_codon:yes stop_codon:yes gene_type:complete
MQQAGTRRWLAFDGCRGVLQTRAPAEVPALLAEVESRVRQGGLHAAGFVTYEAAAGLDPKLDCHAPAVLPCAWFALFDERGETADPAPCGPPAIAWQPGIDAGRYADAIGRIRAWIAAGDTYQVNYSYRLRARLADAAATAEPLFRAMAAGQRTGLGALIDTAAWALCSASPELFFTRRGRRIESRPMKGTAARSSDPEADAAAARWLRDSAKNRAENLMITDMVRNDLGRLADTGSVRTGALFRVEPFPTVWQMTSTVCGDTDADLPALFRALFPAASITGAPKRRTMQIIRALEPEPREIYTGAIGFLEPSGDAQFNVAIRTAWLDKRGGTAEYGVGGGILWDSDADEEFAETALKARVVRAGGSFAPAAPPAADGDVALLETLLWAPDGGFWLLDRHLDRLGDAARHFRRPLRLPDIRLALDRAVAGVGPEPHRVRLLVDACGAATATAAPLADTPPPARVAIAAARRPLQGDPFVRHKTTRRTVYEEARAAHPEADDVLLVNGAGEITESTIANLVVDLDGRLITPPLAAGLLPGVYRAELLEQGRVREGTLTPRDVRRADAVYLVNSVRGMWRVTVVG